MLNQAYNPLGSQVKLSLIEPPICQHCGGPARIADPFSDGFFDCDCAIDRTPVLETLNTGSENWMERYFEEIG